MIQNYILIIFFINHLYLQTLNLTYNLQVGGIFWKFEAYVAYVDSLVKCTHVPSVVIWFVGTVFNGNWEYANVVKGD